MDTKAYVHYSRAPKTGSLYVSESGFSTSENSPRVKGKLILRANPWVLTKSRVARIAQNGPEELAYIPNPSVGVGSWSTSSGRRAVTMSTLRARNQFRSRIYKGSASLGVAIGTYRESREMIVARYGQMTDAMRAIRFKEIDAFRDRKRQTLASSYLELVFGWQPLLADIHAACTSVIQLATVKDYVRGSSIESFQGSYSDNPGSRDVYGGSVRCTISAQCSISNPNLWLLERAGLANPLSVAWDLVPWSFVVNMFVSTGALVNSVSDFLGLSFENESTTYRGVTTGSNFLTNGLPATHPNFGWCFNEYLYTQASRRIGDIPSPPLTWKVPKANWELAAIAASLFTQKFSKLDRFLSLTPSFKRN